MKDALMDHVYNMLQRAIYDLKQEKTDEAMLSVVEARKVIINSLSNVTIEANNFNVLRKVFFLSECVMLHYAVLAQKEKNHEDESQHFLCLSQALGINTLLENSLIPMMLRYVENGLNRQEINRFSEQNRLFKNDLCKKISSIVEITKTKSAGKSLVDINLSVKKIISSVNPSSDEIRRLAVKLGARFDAGNFKQARKIYEFVRDEIQYMYDPLGFEEIQPPEKTLKLRAGDCEDQAILLCSLLTAIGFKSALIFADTNNDEIPDHVYSAVYIPEAPDYLKPLAHKTVKDGTDMNKWIPLDPASQDSDFGVIPIGDIQISDFVPISQS